MKVEIKPSVFLFVAIMALGSSARVGLCWGICAAVLITACVFLHEVAHAMLARWNKVAVSRIGIGLAGGYTARRQSEQLRTELLVTAAGPLMNLALFAFFKAFSTPFTSWIALCNLVLALANLVPFGPTDGARLKRTLTAILRSRRSLVQLQRAPLAFECAPIPAETEQRNTRRLAG